MPLYTYRCDNCGVQFEQSQKFDEKPLTKCPECRKNKLRRIVQPSAIVFKGSGWYATDSRRSTERHMSASSSKSDSGSSDSASSTEKPAGDKAADKPAKTEKAESKPAKTAASSD